MLFKSLFDDGYKEFKRCWKVSKKVLALEEEMASNAREMFGDDIIEYKG